MFLPTPSSVMMFIGILILCANEEKQVNIIDSERIRFFIVYPDKLFYIGCYFMVQAIFIKLFLSISVIVFVFYPDIWQKVWS